MKTEMASAESAMAAVDRITAARAFARQGRAAQLLRHLVGEVIAGRAKDIKEYAIALEVFQRESYDPKIDSLVRVEIAKLRERLAQYYEDEGKDDPVRIEIPKRSYAPLITERVAEPAPVAEPGPTRRFRYARWVVLAGMGVSLAALGLLSWNRVPGGLPGPPSLAVLPFADLSPERNMEAFCDGLTEEVISALANTECLRVAARTSVFEYKNKNRDVRRVGEELKVHAILEGSVRTEGRSVRATFQLINTADGFHLWSETYERELGDPAEVQQNLARTVESVFRFYLTGATRGLTRPGTRNSGAWHYFLRGAHMSTAGEPDKAAEFYRAAVAADPNYALARAGLAQSLVTLADWGMERGGDVLPQAAQEAHRAAELDAEPAIVQQALGQIKVFVERDWKGAESAFRKAIDSDPTDVNLLYDYARLVLAAQGRFDEAIGQLKRALAMHPRGNHLMNELAFTYIRAGRHSEALPVATQSLGITPKAPGAHVLRGLIASAQTGYASALPHFERAVALRPTDWTRTHLAFALAKLGRRDKAEAVLRELKDDYYIAVLHMALGRREQALAALEKALMEPSPAIPWVKVDSWMLELRDEPRFNAILANMDLQ